MRIFPGGKENVFAVSVFIHLIDSASIDKESNMIFLALTFEMLKTKGKHKCTEKQQCLTITIA